MECKHRACSRQEYRRGICQPHYRQMMGLRPVFKKEKPLTQKELNGIDLDDFWNWVKIELGLESNKKITTEKTAHKH